jgi:putative ABC transport system permease protein
MIALVFKSLRNRLAIASLTALSVALSVFLFASVEKLREGARAGFSQTVSGTHIVAGARSGQIPLLLFSLFHIGSPTSNVSYASYLKYKKNPAVAWALPLSIGDSHKGFRVVGTSANFMKHFRYRNQQQLRLAEGSFSLARLKAVLGSTAARELRYAVGSKLVLTHGISDVQGIHDHEESPFVVEGVLEATGTPLDKGIYVSLESIELMHHEEEHEGAGAFHGNTPAPSKITSFLIGVKQPVDILPLMRQINEDETEPLTAILPGVVLSEIWNIMGYAESILKLVSLMVMLTALCGLFIALYASLAERYREMAILRALGASPRRIASLLVAESLILTVAGIVAGYALIGLVSLVFKNLLLRAFSVGVGVFPLTQGEYWFVGVLLFVGLVVALLPAWLLYRRALGEGLQVRQ